MRLQDFLYLMWYAVDQVMQTRIPVFEYTVSLWNIFYFTLVGVMLIYFVFAMATPKRGK